jgi:hypothetical protein
MLGRYIKTKESLVRHSRMDRKRVRRVGIDMCPRGKKSSFECPNEPFPL